MFINNTIDKYRRLQLFADSGTVVQTTTGTANAYTGDVTTTDALSPSMKVFYDTELLENARREMLYGQFAKHITLPANHGTEMEFRKFTTFARASVLQEGVIPTGQTFGMTAVKFGIQEYGTFTALSTRVQTRLFDPVLMAATDEMSHSAADTQEVLVRDSLLTNPNVLYADNITLADGKKTGTTPVSCAEMEASATVCAILAPDTLAKAARIMRKNKVPHLKRTVRHADGTETTKHTGKWGLVVHPSVKYNLVKHPDFVEVHKYCAPEEIFHGECGELHGFIIMEDADAPVLGGTYKNKAGTNTYASYAFGQDAYCVIDPGNGNLRMIIKNASEVGGPLEQFGTVGYKFETGSAILYAERLLRIMSCTEFSDEDEIN